MAYGGNYRNLRMVNGQCYLFVIKSPQILDGAAAPAYNQKICQLIIIGVADGGDNLPRSLGTLHPDRKQVYLAQGITLVQNSQHVVNRRTGGAGDNADSAGIPGQRLLMGWVEKPLGRQLLFQLLKGNI